MAKRRKMSNGKSRKLFRKSSGSRGENTTRRPMRGGFRF